VSPARGTPAHQRNRAWRAARAPLIAFTDDDCRPAPGWLEHLLRAAADHPGAVIHGATTPDPDEEVLVHRAARVRTLRVDPPSIYAPTCNIAYPRALLESLDGFDESLRRPGGEDTDLALRARASGAGEIGEARAVVWHAVRVLSLRAAIADAWRWRDLPLTVARHPQLRDGLAGRVFWRGSHALLPLAVAGLAAAPRRPALALAALPWAVSALPARGTHLRGRLRAVSELPGRAVVEATEMAALAYGSARARTLML
jgi:GT2 family glycosyltransferase